MTLNDYSARFLNALRAAFPDLGGRLAAAKEPGCFSLAIPTAAGTVRVSTEAFGQVRIEAGGQTASFGGWADPYPEQSFEDAVSYLRGCLAPAATRSPVVVLLDLLRPATPRVAG